jgi:hypothetical protein
MTAQPTFNPFIQNNATGSFNISANGLVQGTAFDDPATRYRMRGGYLASTETIPMWGGVGISENVPLANTGSPLPPNATLGGKIIRASTLTAQAAGQLTGFSVFDQNYSAVQSPQSPVPLVGSGATLNLYPLGSLARIAVACDPSLVSLDGGLITQLVSWDFTNQRLIPYSATYPQATVTNAVWASTSGGQTTFTVGTDLTSYIDAGDDIQISGVVSTGATTDGYNGSFTVVSINATTIVVTQTRAASPGTYASGGIVVAGGGALPCKVLRVSVGDCMTVSYDSTTGFATWNRSGSCAVIQI